MKVQANNRRNSKHRGLYVPLEFKEEDNGKNVSVPDR